MAPTIPTVEPTSVIAGDSWKWDKYLGDFPASEGWQLSYSLRGETDLDFAWSTRVTANGDKFEVRIPAATTAPVKPGPYELLGRVTDGTDTYTPVRCSLIVQANPTTAVNSKSDLLLTIEAIEAALLANAGAFNVVRVSINGRSTEFATPDEARRALDRLRIEYELERNPNARLSHAARFVAS